MMRIHSSRLHILAALSLPIVTAFQDASPFFLISPSRFDFASPPSSPLSTEYVVTAAKEAFSLCASEAYILVYQPGIHASDLALSSSAPTLYRELKASHGRSLTAPNVFQGNIKTEELVEVLQRFAMDKCDAEVEEVDAKTGFFGGFGDMRPKVIRVDFDALPDERNARATALKENDSFLNSILELLPTTKFTLVYTSTPISVIKHQARVYTDHELKRRGAIERDERSNATTTGGLFSRYQFFSPGIFMGYIGVFFLLCILYVGVSAVSSLTVTYGAFEKEMGLAAQKKQ